VSTPSKRRNEKRFASAPLLRAGGENKRQPVRWDGGVEKSDAEPGDCDGSQDGIVHPFRPQIMQISPPADMVFTAAEGAAEFSAGYPLSVRLSFSIESSSVGKDGDLPAVSI
jgi:hypothetical protein